MIPLFKVYMSPTVKDKILDVLYSGYITEGTKVQEFEYHLKRYLDIKNLLTVNSGTSALQLALHVAGICPTDKQRKYVISTPQTCSATNTAIRAVGADIIWADINPNDGNISVDSIKNILNSSTHNKPISAIMCVHWGGMPCDMEEINALAMEYGIPVIEDAAHALGSIYKNKYIGNHSDFVAFSLQAIKTLTTVDGGLLACKDDFDNKEAKLLRWFGIDRDLPRNDMRCELDIVTPGYKYHMNDVNACIGIENLKDLSELIKMQQINAKYYDDYIEQYAKNIEITSRNNNKQSSYWLYTIFVNNPQEFRKFMEHRGIVVSQVHSRNDTHSMFEQYRTTLPGVDEFCSKQINIPCGWWLTKEEQGVILQAVEDWGKMNR